MPYRARPPMTTPFFSCVHIRSETCAARSRGDHSPALWQRTLVTEVWFGRHPTSADTGSHRLQYSFHMAGSTADSTLTVPLRCSMRRCVHVRKSRSEWPEGAAPFLLLLKQPTSQLGQP